MTSIKIPCKKCGKEKTHTTSYLDAPIKFLFFCDEERCRTPNGVILKFADEKTLIVSGKFNVAARPLPLPDLDADDAVLPDELSDLIE